MSITQFFARFGQYVAANPALSELLFDFTGPIDSAADNLITGPLAPQVPRDFASAMKTSARLRSLRIHGIPQFMASPTSEILLATMSSWSKLITVLVLRVAFGGSDESSNQSITFPGLSILASAIWKHCPNLEELEYHFDKDLVATEDLAIPAPLSEYAAGYIYHRLRKLCINTDRTTDESKQLELSMQRKIQIATFIDRLFPVLETLEGSAADVWDEIAMMVKAFQDQRACFAAQVDGVLAGY